MSTQKGSLSIHSENIFPIIKKWLYSDKDIYVRELISNACDAISKLKKLESMGETTIAPGTNFKVTVELDDKEKTIKIIDNGIGMTSEEVKKYIAQIAFSGAEDFLEQYKDKADKDQIIGHFGLGFYSAFMVAGKIQIDTLSYKDGSTAARWICDGGSEYEMSDSDRSEIGTTITLFINDDGEGFLNEYTLRSTIEKYCSFMPIEIYLENVNKEIPAPEENKDPENKDEIKIEEPKPLNDIAPLWTKKPSDCTDEEYKEFYRKTFKDFKEPLFWIHLNMDYPLNLKGILYFPKLSNEFETSEGQVKLFCNQVFVADNIKEAIPEFLLLLKGAIDCPEFPLNVSRSFLQNDGYVTKISEYISKKVADKLKQLYKKERENFEKYWEDINPFIKYGCLKDDKFYEKVKDIIIFKTTNGKFVSLGEYTENNKEKLENNVYYVTDEQQQSQYVKMFKDNGMEAIIAPSTIDQPFISHLEMKNTEVKFKRIDSDLTDTLKESDENEETAKADQETLEVIFKEALNIEALKVQAETLKSEKVSGMILLSEESRRMQDMMKQYGMMGMGMGMNMPMGDDETLVINKKNNLVKFLLANKDTTDKKDDLKLVCQQIYDLAMLSHKPLSPDALTNFVERSNLILSKLI